MLNKETVNNNWEKRFRHFIHTHSSLSVIVLATLLLELTTAVMYYNTQNIIRHDVEQLVERDMNAIDVSVSKQMTKVEVALNNMAWVVGDNILEPDSLFGMISQIVKHNHAIIGSSISCVPNLYPQYGRWFEAYAVRRADGTIETMQLGSEDHDYTTSEFYTIPIITGDKHWSEPYFDEEGAKTMLTTYSVPVRNREGIIVAVVDADLSLDWMDELMAKGRIGQSSKRFMVTSDGNIIAGDEGPICKVALDQIMSKNDTKGYFTLKYENVKKHVFYSPVGGQTDWLIINILDDSELYGKLRGLRMSLVLLLFVGFIIVGFIVWRTSHNLERLRKVKSEKERISSELRVASKLQQNMLPRNKMDRSDVDVCGSLMPAREVGGDLFDYFVRNEKLFFCIGDVSGKGMPAAMLMTVTLSLFRAFSTHENNPAHIMQRINESTCPGNDTNMFVTLIIGVLDLPTGRLRYCNAGHDIPVIVSNILQPLECTPNMPIGLFDDVKYEVQDTYLAPNSTFFLFTDGLTEAKNAACQQFGQQRVDDVLIECYKQKLSPHDLLDAISESVRLFVNGAEQSDDLTMLAIRYNPQQFESILSESITLKNDVHELARLSTFQQQVYEKMNIEKSQVRQLRLAIEEAVVNVIEYAYPVGSEGSVEVRIMYDGHLLKVVIVDSGISFDPTTKEDVDTTLSVENRNIGGLGIHMVRELVDSTNYERIDGQNILTLIKQIN